jgi:hypothetical protein
MVVEGDCEEMARKELSGEKKTSHVILSILYQDTASED